MNANILHVYLYLYKTSIISSTQVKYCCVDHSGIRGSVVLNREFQLHVKKRHLWPVN